MKKILSYFLNDNFVSILIIINTILIIYSCYDIGQNNHFTLLLIDSLLTILFLFEIIYKLYFYRKDFFKRKSNVFDLIIITISSLPLFTLILFGNELNLQYFLLLRVFRLVKLLRLVRLIPSLGKLWSDLKRAFKTSIGVIFGGLITLIIISTILCSIFKTASPTYFGDPLTAFYSVFRLFSIEGWYEIPDEIASGLGYGTGMFIKYIFLLLVLIGGVFGMSFITSVFVDELAADNNDRILEQNKELSKKIDNLNQMLENITKQLNN